MAKLTESVSAVTPLGDALREPAKAPRKRRESTTREPLDVAWSCPCHGTRFDDLWMVYLHLRAELKSRIGARKANGDHVAYGAECGTVGGYHKHIRAHEETCARCRSAWNGHKAARKAAQQQDAA